jgi:pyrophosphate--fructose-6-phosphate 1-phosphotransferase
MLSAYLAEHDYKLVVVGMPKTVDNDVVPVRQSLGAWTAAEEGARFFSNVVNESSANPRMLIIHECMGRDCGYLTAYTGKVCQKKKKKEGTWWTWMVGVTDRSGLNLDLSSRDV